MLRRYFLLTFLLVVTGSLLSDCKMSYSFTGANLSPEIKTFSVYYFPNRAKLINPTLSQSFTEGLKDKLNRQTPLDELAENGDIEFEGQITEYRFQPMSVAKDDVSQQTRLTVEIKVKYTNHKEPDADFEQTFSAFEDYDSNLSISSVEDGLVVLIINKLTEDIFNATIANW